MSETPTTVELLQWPTTSEAMEAVTAACWPPVVPSVGAVPVEVPEEAAINELATALMDAWATAEPNHSITKHPVSYVATFVDLARAAYPLIAARVLADREAEWAEAERIWEQAIQERDEAEEWADRLAAALAGGATGEHSSANNPWQNALDIAADRDARVRAEEQQRIATGLDLGELLDEYAAELGMPVADSDARDALVARYEDDLRALVLAPGSAVPVATPGATSLDAAGIMRRFDQEISRSRDVIGRMDMGRPPASVATPTEPTEPVDEVVCPNCQHTIRARMSDQPGPCTSECGKPADQTCLQWACRKAGADLAAPAEQDGQR